MSAAVSPVPRLTFFANDGSPLSGGFVYTYAAGTTTPKTTYSNEALSTPISNPIVLNAAGRPQASAIDTTEVNVYLQASSYKFVVQDSNSSTIYTADNIEAVSPNPVTVTIAFPQAVTGGVSGGVPYFSSTTVMAASGLLTASDLVKGGGSGSAPASWGTQSANTIIAGPVSGSAAVVTQRALNPLDIHAGCVAVCGTQFDSTSTNLANVTGLTLTLVAGQTYNFRAFLFVTEDTTGGAKLAVGGTATATTFRASAMILANGAAVEYAVGTSLGSAILSATSAVAANAAIIEGYIVVNAGGTLTIQFAQNSATGTSSVLVGSYLTVF